MGLGSVVSPAEKPALSEIYPHLHGEEPMPATNGGYWSNTAYATVTNAAYADGHARGVPRTLSLEWWYAPDKNWSRYMDH